MVNIKAYTDLSQSKVFAEFLPLESADMLFQLGEDKYANSIRVSLTNEHWKQIMPNINPCWSLIALLSVLPDYTLKSSKFYGKVALWCQGISVEYDNPIHACYEMIIKLHEQNLL